MGNYLNSVIPWKTYQGICNAPYYIDKTMLLESLTKNIETTEKYICITRPRRFGKTVMANMIAAFFSVSDRKETLFRSLGIGQSEAYEKCCGKYDVIMISFNELPRRCEDYESYIKRIEERLIRDLQEAYPAARIEKEDAVWDALTAVFHAYDAKQFIFVFDEWDYIFHRDFVTEVDKRKYVGFLSNLLKDKAYVALAYMTGILPIAKYSSGSELNMFMEYTMATKEKYSDYFGFSDEEVDMLYERYRKIQPNPKITREELKIWYDGYQTPKGIRIYNPRSVVCALSDNQLNSYWTSSGPYDEIYYYVSHNVAAVRDDLAHLVSGMSVPAKVQEYAAVSMNLTTREEILSAMVVYGFLSYDSGRVSIPNKELMDKFNEMLMKEPSVGYVHQLAEKSAQMLAATLAGDEKKVTQNSYLQN